MGSLQEVLLGLRSVYTSLSAAYRQGCTRNDMGLMLGVYLGRILDLIFGCDLREYMRITSWEFCRSFRKLARRAWQQGYLPKERAQASPTVYARLPDRSTPKKLVLPRMQDLLKPATVLTKHSAASLGEKRVEGRNAQIKVRYPLTVQ